MALHPFSWIGPAALSRLTLLLNHVVASEPLATGKLQPHAGRIIDIRWTSNFNPPLPGFFKPTAGATSLTPPPLRLMITPAGLFEAVEQNLDTTVTPSGGLILTVHLLDPVSTLRQTLKGERPEVTIEGDAALAEAASWLMKNLRWDIQDDVARVLGNTPAELLRTVGDSLRQSLIRWRPGAGSDGTSPSRH